MTIISTANFLDSIITLRFISADLQMWAIGGILGYIVLLYKLPIPTIVVSVIGAILWGLL